MTTQWDFYAWTADEDTAAAASSALSLDSASALSFGASSQNLVTSGEDSHFCVSVGSVIILIASSNGFFILTSIYYCYSRNI